MLLAGRRLRNVAVVRLLRPLRQTCATCGRRALRGAELFPRTESEAFGWCCRRCWHAFASFEERQEYLVDDHGQIAWLKLDPGTALVVDTECLQVAAISAHLDQLGNRVRVLSPPAARMAINRYSVFRPNQPRLFRDRASALRHIGEQLATSLSHRYAAGRYELATFGQGSGLVLEERFGEQYQHRQSQECWLLDTEGALYHYYPFHR